MNALATDQARRIADLIHSILVLAGLRAGLYHRGCDESPRGGLTATSVITQEPAQGAADILLTNYKAARLPPHATPNCGRASGTTTSIADGISTWRYLGGG